MMKHMLALILSLMMIFTLTAAQASDTESMDNIYRDLKEIYPEIDSIMDEWDSIPEETRAMLYLLIKLNAQLDDSTSEEDVSAYVIAHEEQLAQIATTVTTRFDDEIFSILGEDTLVKSVSRRSPQIVDFYCGGTGMLSHTTYIGFYYSADDVPYANEFSTMAEFTDEGNGVFSWADEESGYSFRTVRILPHWFYYHEKWD